jgi:hypothetical protein
MAEDQPTTEFEEADDTAPPPPAGGQSPLSVGTDDDAFADRPEAFVGAAFAGGLALALILRRLTR